MGGEWTENVGPPRREIVHFSCEVNNIRILRAGQVPPYSSHYMHASPPPFGELLLNPKPHTQYP